MDLTNASLILIGILVVAVIYLQLRLSFLQPQTVVMVPQAPANGGAGCAVAALVILAIGVGIAFVQALTQIQEITLTFVPKIVAILITVAVSAPFVGAQLALFTNMVFSRIETGF